MERRSWHCSISHCLAPHGSSSVIESPHDHSSERFYLGYYFAAQRQQGRVPGTDKWKSIQETPEAEEAVPGVLIIRIRENLDFGK
jgi:hypothetical protein